MAQSLQLGASVMVRGGGTLADSRVLEGLVVENSLLPVSESAGIRKVAA